jgi:hypothetical protein
MQPNTTQGYFLRINTHYSPLVIKFLPTNNTSVNSNMLHGNNCDAVPQGLPSRRPALSLALILSDHTDQGSVDQSLDAVVPD